MYLKPLRWIGQHISTIFLAVILSIAVWVSAVVTADPNEEQTSRPITIEVLSQNPKMQIVNEIPNEARLTLRAPRSIWKQLNDNPNLMRAWIDLAGVASGEHRLEVKTSVDINPFRYVEVDPEEVVVVMEPRISVELPINLNVNGEPPLGYRKGTATLTPSTVEITGPESSVNMVAEAHADIDISGDTETINSTAPIEVEDGNGNSVKDIDISPKEVSVVQNIQRLGGFKNVVVKVTTTGQVANGYRLTNIAVTPPTVTVFSEEPEKVDEMPGFVETIPVDLTGMSDDTERSVDVYLPEGVSLVSEPNVLVQVSVAAIESSKTFSVPVEFINLSPDLEATISPTTVDVIAAGPLNLLEELTETDFRVIVDLEGLPPGIYQRQPIVDQIPEKVRVQTTLPDTVEVDLTLAPTPTPTATLPPDQLLTPTP